MSGPAAAPAAEPPPRATPQGRRTAAIVVTSLGALLLAAAAIVFMVIAWDLLRLPGKVGVVGVASATCLMAGYQLRQRLPGVAAVLTHLGAVLAPLVAGAGAVVLNADRPTVAVVGGAVGVVVLQLFDRMQSPVLAAGRAIACAGVAIGLGVWLGVSPALLLLATTSLFALARRWEESITTALLAASTPLIEWGATFSEPGSLLVWIDELASMNQWVTAAVAVGSLIVISAQVIQLPPPRLSTAKARWATTVGTAIFAINVAAFADTAMAYPDQILILLAATVLVTRVVERLWVRSIGLYLDAATWLVSGVTWMYLLADEAPRSLQSPELIASVLVLTSWLLTDVLFGSSSSTNPLSRMLHGASGPMASVGIAAASISIAVASNHSFGSTLGLVTLGTLFAIGSRTHRSELALVAFTGALIAALASPLLLPVVAAAVIVAATFMMLTDLRRGAGPRALQPVQVASLSIVGVAALIEPAITEPSWWSTSIYLASLAGSAVALTRRTRVPDLLVAPRLALAIPVLAALGDLRLAGIFAVITGAALIVDRVVHHVKASEHLGIGLTTVGSWLLAADAGVTAPEVYIAAPCLALAYLGWNIVRRGGSSWLGLAPAVGLFTLVALVERLDGGNGWHAVAAGAVAIVATVLGVDRRWAGPSFVGAASLIVVVGVETATYVPAVPLWIWLAIGGVSLVGAGIHLERSADEEGTASLRTAWASFR